MKRVYFQKTEDQIEWVKNNCMGLKQDKAHALFCDFWKVDISIMQFKSLLWNYKIKLKPRGVTGPAPLPEGTIRGMTIKHNGKQIRIRTYLGIGQLQKLAKEKLKIADPELAKRNKSGDKRRRVNDPELLENLVNSENA